MRVYGAPDACDSETVLSSFNATLKRDTLAGEHAWTDVATCRHEVFKWILRYSNRRRHSACGYLSPVTYEQATTQSTTTSTTLAA